MKVLGHIHTYNDESVIDATMAALCAQTFPIPEILLVDNASTDRTLDRPFPDTVTIIRHRENLGTSGSVRAGLKYAIDRGYDWIYILDADSAPKEDAVETLIRLYESFSADLQEKIWWLGSLPREAQGGTIHHGCVFTPTGIEMLQPGPQEEYYECNTNMWTGSLYKIEAVKKVGLPDPNYVLDWGDVIYGYEGMVRGYKGFVHQRSEVRHNLHPLDTLHFLRFHGRFVKVFYSPPIRFYYLWRNRTYFWMYRYDRGTFFDVQFPHFVMFVKWLIKASLFLKRPTPILIASTRGLWHGLFGRLDKRY